MIITPDTIRGITVFGLCRTVNWSPLYTVHIGYSDNGGDTGFMAKLSLYPIIFVWDLLGDTPKATKYHYPLYYLLKCGGSLYVDHLQTP